MFPVLSDLTLVHRWMHDAAATEDFWSSRPRWSDDTARAATGVPEAPLVVWSSAGVFNVGDPAATIAGFVDGEVTLAELAEDLAAVAEAPLDHARAVVAAMAVELSNLGALEGVALPDPPSQRWMPTIHRGRALGLTPCPPRWVRPPGSTPRPAWRCGL